MAATVLARADCRVIQLRHGHGDHLEVVSLTRTDSLAARILEPPVSEPRDQAIIALGTAALSSSWLLLPTHLKAKMVK